MWTNFQNFVTNWFMRRFSMYTRKDFHLTCNRLLCYVVKVENPKLLLIFTLDAASTNTTTPLKQPYSHWEKEAELAWTNSTLQRAQSCLRWIEWASNLQALVWCSTTRPLDPLCVFVHDSSGTWITSCRWPKVEELAMSTTCGLCVQSAIGSRRRSSTKIVRGGASFSLPPTTATSLPSFAQSFSLCHWNCEKCNHHHHHFWFAFVPLKGCSTTRRQRPPESPILIHVDRFSQCEIVGLQIVKVCLYLWKI